MARVGFSTLAKAKCFRCSGVDPSGDSMLPWPAMTTQRSRSFHEKRSVRQDQLGAQWVLPLLLMRRRSGCIRFHAVRLREKRKSTRISRRGPWDSCRRNSIVPCMTVIHSYSQEWQEGCRSASTSLSYESIESHQDQVASFNRNGFLLIRGFIKPDLIAAIQHDLDWLAPIMSK